MATPGWPYDNLPPAVMDSVVAPEKQLPPCATRTGLYRGEHGAEDLIELIIFSQVLGFGRKNIRLSCEIGWIQVPDSKEAIRDCSVALACQRDMLEQLLGYPLECHW